MPLFTQVRGIGFLRTSPFGDSQKFACTEFSEVRIVPGPMPSGLLMYRTGAPWLGVHKIRIMLHGGHHACPVCLARMPSSQDRGHANKVSNLVCLGDALPSKRGVSYPLAQRVEAKEPRSRPSTQEEAVSADPQEQTQATVVLVHGAFAESASWNDVIRRLQDRDCQELPQASSRPGRGGIIAVETDSW
jgi:hypothetical protein